MELYCSNLVFNPLLRKHLFYKIQKHVHYSTNTLYGSLHLKLRLSNSSNLNSLFAHRKYSSMNKFFVSELPLLFFLLLSLNINTIYHGFINFRLKHTLKNIH